MKTLYLDIFSGLSGDMFIGALLDLGVDFHRLEHALEELGLEDYHLHFHRGQRAQIAGTRFEVHLEHDPHHHHHHDHEDEPGHEPVAHEHSHAQPHAPDKSHHQDHPHHHLHHHHHHETGPAHAHDQAEPDH